MRKWLLLSVLGFAASCGQGNSGSAAEHLVSDLKRDETVVFFDTSAWLDLESGVWHLPIHGWIYEPQNSTVRRAAFEAVLKRKFDLTVSEESAENFSSRLNLLLADNERGKKLVVNIDGDDYPLNASVENGHFKTTLRLPATAVEKVAVNGFLDFDLVTGANDARTISGRIQLLQSDGIGVISDIDDTVKISNVTNHKALLEQTFLLDFSAAPGMPYRYRKWASAGVSFHYVSSSPWQLYPPLKQFLIDSELPWASMSLKSVRFRDETLLDLFKEGTETKPAAIKEILDRYPGRRFILVGDSGEQDPEVYAALLRERPQQIGGIYIRNVTQETPDNDRFTTVFAGIEEQRWTLFKDPDTLPENLAELAW